MSNRIYNVKQAAKILGLSTNTTYKYLNQGRIKAARGHIRGTFIISTKSLEDFLGTKLPEESIIELENNAPLYPSRNTDAEAIIEVTPPTLTTQVVRVLLIVCLGFIILDLLINKNFTPIAQLNRLSLISIFVLVTYQFGGFTKK